MKRPAFIVSIIPLIFISCSSPQSTVTPEATRTPTVEVFATPSNTSESPTITPEPTLSPAEKLDQQLQATGLFPDHTPENPAYTIGTDADGKILATDKAGNVIFWDGQWSTDHILKIIADSGQCKPTNIASIDSPGYYPETDYMREQAYKEPNSPIKNTMSYGPRLIPGTNNCWSVLFGTKVSKTKHEWKFITWLNKANKIKIMPIYTPKPKE